jgi:dihydrofolate synthase/folylpolyglutamate synthase
VTPPPRARQRAEEQGARQRLEEQSARLLARVELGVKLGLGPLTAALARLGDPHDELIVVHVAGTNGKGSSAAMVEAMLRAAGLKTGLYTSPHLCRLSERIRIDGEPIDDELFAEALERALAEDTPPLSFFEVLTSAALWAMVRVAVDVAILEVGLGGRLDATNVVKAPWVTAITSIGRDHLRELGPDLASVAREKAGICKRGAPLVLGTLPAATQADDDPLRAIVACARHSGADPIWGVAATSEETRVLADLGVNPITVARAAERVSITLPSRVTLEATPSLAGPHQASNAAVAVASAWLLLQRMGRATSAAPALVAGIESTRWPGRFETVDVGGVSVVLDCAHNVDGAMALDRALDERGIAPQVLVFGALCDKDWRAMLEVVGARSAHRLYVEPLPAVAGRRSVACAELTAVLPGIACASAAEALARGLGRAKPGDTVLVTGSVFLVGAVRAALFAEGKDVLVPL